MTHQQAVTTFASERYLLDEMTEVERSRFEEHYFTCTECAEDVRTGAIMQEGAKAGLLPQGGVETPAAVVSIRSRRTWYQSATIPWAVAATLAVVVGYQSLGRLPGSGQAPMQALSPVTLRPASRGQDPVVRVGVDSQSIALAVDVMRAEGPEMIYDLRTAEGTRVLSGRTATPPSGSPLVLVIAARAVNLPGHYVLTVSGTEYRFELVSP